MRRGHGVKHVLVVDPAHGRPGRHRHLGRGERERAVEAAGHGHEPDFGRDRALYAFGQSGARVTENFRSAPGVTLPHGILKSPTATARCQSPTRPAFPPCPFAAVRAFSAWKLVKSLGPRSAVQKRPRLATPR